MSESLRVKGVEFRLDGLPPEAERYLRGKLKRGAKRESRGFFTRLFDALLPASYARVPVESLVQGRALVVGCAGGIEALGLKAVGLDVDRDALAIADALGRHARDVEGRFLAASGSDLPFPDGLFDSLLSDDVVEHMPAALLPRHLKEARRVLRDGGRYVFTTPNRLFENPPKEGHISLRSYAEWEALCREAGFSATLTPLRRSGPLEDLAWKKAAEAGSPSRFGLSRKGLRTVTIVAVR